MRTDIPIGLQFANVVHAAGESSPGNMKPGTHAVCLGVPHEEALRAVADRLSAAGIPFVSIIESDAPFTDCLMALGCAPDAKEVFRRCLSALPLVR